MDCPSEYKLQIVLFFVLANSMVSGLHHLQYYKTDSFFLFEPVLNVPSASGNSLRIEISRPDGLIRVNGTSRIYLF